MLWSEEKRPETTSVRQAPKMVWDEVVKLMCCSDYLFMRRITQGRPSKIGQTAEREA